ncbi:MAG TPA: serine/threonine protein phosphatase [Deltaproteobacteria bacterium]|nr:serine/threonine protein phosphatase [Deltaproteobacteria bacterium]
MQGRTFAIGDIHGEIGHLRTLLERMGPFDEDDTLVFLGDYVDRGPHSRQVIEFIRHELPETGVRIVALRGNHEDAWLRVIDEGWDGFVLPPSNGCLACLRSYTGGPVAPPHDYPRSETEWEHLIQGTFFPRDVIDWMRSLPYWYEDDHAIYVHAGLPQISGGFPHPSDVQKRSSLLWTRTREFFQGYRGKTCIVGHTVTSLLPPELSHHAPRKDDDLWVGEQVIAIDTGCGKGGFLTAIELPELFVWESREPLRHQRAQRWFATPP